MQLVVMVTVVLGLLAGARRGCGFGCHPTNLSISVTSCGLTKCVNTTICEGQCYQKDLNYIRPILRVQQEICNGDWSDEVTYIEGCPVGVTYPVARNCRCTLCNPVNTECERFRGAALSCSKPRFFL
uniref:Glycoprotein hormone subunit beta domain-containing protein n=1 Tax=Salarias fasciatus TaxID=181472 RepID=A0A672JHU6_SALFA